MRSGRRVVQMLTTLKRVGAIGVAVAALTGGVIAAPSAASPVVTGGLVNVTITDVLSHNVVTVKVPVNVALQLAANVCGVTVGVLVQDLHTGSASCSTATQSIDITQVL
jgi:hypothetical protein